MNSAPHWLEPDPEHLVSEILIEFKSTGTCPRDRVSKLVALAVSDDERTAERASRAFFTSLVEPLADSFQPAAASLYNQAFAQLVQACRNTARGRPLDEKLREFGLLSEADVLARAERLRTNAPWSGLQPSKLTSEPSRILVLSRVTLGADVALTSAIVERLMTTFSQAEIVLVGGRKASELFGGDPRVTFQEISYPAKADALDRLLAWIPLVDRVRELTGVGEAAGTTALPGSDWLIVDPDSRLTQLGLLPLVPERGDLRAGRAGYLFFPSREYHHESSASLAELTSSWLDEVLGLAPPVTPSVSLTSDDLQAGRALADGLRREGHPVIAINFGVGGNPAKRVGTEFECQLVSALLEAGSTILLDKGAGAEEAQRAEDIIEFAKNRSTGSLKVVEIDQDSLSQTSSGARIEADLIVWNGRIGLLAALIGASDLYIGYDSAGQHIAAALGVPCVDVFAGFSSRRMLDRWRPTGKAETRVVIVEQGMSEDEVLTQTLRHAQELLRAG
jgi:ADP-heptose:LPS heptosyltransferase